MHRRTYACDEGVCVRCALEGNATNMREGYAVQVLYLGEPILTIERTMLAGKSELSDEDKLAIDDAGEHLIAFAGVRLPPCGFNPDAL